VVGFDHFLETTLLDLHIVATFGGVYKPLAATKSKKWQGSVLLTQQKWIIEPAKYLCFSHQLSSHWKCRVTFTTAA
jgi:hypothetical protein